MAARREKRLLRGNDAFESPMGTNPVTEVVMSGVPSIVGEVAEPVVEASPTSTASAWLREITVNDLFVFLIKLTAASLMWSALLAIPALIVYLIVVHS